MKRRSFVATAGAAVAASLVPKSVQAMAPAAKKKMAMVGTGIRGIGFWGNTVVKNYGDSLEFVGLCDVNPGRLEMAKNEFAPNARLYSDFDKMLDETKPDMVVVTTVDATHHEFIIKALNKGVDVITEKPLTTDELKCQAILDAERKSGRKVIVGFNYRYGTLPTAIKEQLAQNAVGRITSVDFHWYLNVYHGADYFRRWHRLKAMGGSLWVHKATHHFDLLNWWIDSDPVEVVAYGDLEHYGRNNSFRHSHCRPCPHKDKCRFYWDITKNDYLTRLYANNEHYDGYLRDGCVWKEDIDIYDKMSAQIRYANGVLVNYSLTTYSPYEGWRIAFNGMDGRIDSWEDIPWQQGKDELNQAERHAVEMQQGGSEASEEFDQIMLMKNFEDYRQIKVPRIRAGHGGGDRRLQDRIFKDPNAPDPLRHAAGTRDGAMSILIGIAARKSIETGRKVLIEELTDLKPSVKRL